jgi:hypothetical protein
MSTGLPSNVLPEDCNWSPSPSQLSDWKSKYPTDVWKANADNPNWKDLDGAILSTIPISACGYAIWEWQVVSGSGAWVEIESARQCEHGCEPVSPLTVSGAMPLNMRIAKECGPFE